MKRCLPHATTASPEDHSAIGSMETTAAVRLPALLADFHRRFPAVRLRLRTATDRRPRRRRPRRELDGAFIAGPIEHAELTARRSRSREELVLVTATTAGAPCRPARRHTGFGPTALVFRTGCTYRQRLEQVSPNSAGRPRHASNSVRSTA